MLPQPTRFPEEPLADGLVTELVTVFCIRRHVPHDGLYDLVVRSATIGKGRTAVISNLRANPITFSNALTLARRWWRAFSWTN